MVLKIVKLFSVTHEVSMHNISIANGIKGYILTSGTPKIPLLVISNNRVK